MSLTYIAKKFMYSFTAFIINFCTQIFYKFHKLFPCETPESKFDLTITIVKVDPMSSSVYFWAKSFKIFHEILSSKFFPMFDFAMK